MSRPTPDPSPFQLPPRHRRLGLAAAPRADEVAIAALLVIAGFGGTLLALLLHH